MNLAAAPTFQAIPEWDDALLALFPHRHDYIWAEHPNPGDRPDWQTERRHPLSDRLIQQGAYLYGVRFGPRTRYLLLDIDANSLYHPAHDLLATRRLLAALEPLNLVAWVAISSSDSGGLHLYLPFEQEQESWAIAQAAATLLESAGYKLVPGQLELFPNPRPYSDTRSLYLAHRLPLQAGSYLLNADFQPIYSTPTTFVQHWHQAQRRNTLTPALLQRVLKRVQRQRYRLSTKASKFLNDLNAEVEPGWTQPGQTNYLLGRITMREYIFGHLHRRCEPLTDAALVAAICEVARALPGFSDYCNHQRDLEQRAQFYARSIQASRYYPCGRKHQPNPHPAASSEPTPPSWNQRQAHSARDRIQQAVADLLTHHALPSQVTARKNAIKAYGIGGDTLKKYPELWHPNYLQPLPAAKSQPINATPPSPEPPEPLPAAESQPIESNKLVPTVAALQGPAAGSTKVGGYGGFSTTRPSAVAVAERLAKMQAWLASGDRILMAEAAQYFAAVQPGAAKSALIQGTDLAPQSGELLEGGTMPGGFGAKRSPSRGRQGRSQPRQPADSVTQASAPESQSEAAIQAAVDALFAQEQPEQSEDLAIAWAAGVYHPLAAVDLLAVGARFLEPAEEDWLAIARMVEWLDVEDGLDAIYFTAPPPNFALEQADWYVRPDLTVFLEEPMLLREVIQRYPIPLAAMQGAIAQRFLRLGWPAQQQEQFMWQLFEQPQSALTEDDWEFLLFELESQV